MGRPSHAGRVPLADVSVRPVRDLPEQVEWDRLMDEHHYLGFRCLFGGGLRHVAELPDGRRVALLGWSSGSFKVGARDAWIGWAPEQRFRRLRLVANNTRFLILPGFNGGNLASRVLSLSLRRLSGDFEASRGHPVLLAETFVDPSRFAGACYRASNWLEVGVTRGYGRARGDWIAHGRPKRVFVRPLARGVAEALRGLDEPASWGGVRACPAAPPPGRLRSLYEHLDEVPELRSARGVRHRLATVLAVAAAAKLAGARGPTAIAEFAARLTRRQLAEARAFRSPSTGRLVPPSRSSVHRILAGLDPEALEGAVRAWSAARRAPREAVALDGKSAPLNRPGGPDADRMMVAAAAHGGGEVVGRTGSDGAGGEILGARRLLREVGVAGRVVTADAPRACPKTARLIIDGGGDYVFPVKGNHQDVLDDIRAFDFDAAPARRTLGKGHGRIEERTCAVVPLDGCDGDIADLPERRKAFRVVRRRTVVATGRTTVETTHGLTSLPPERAGPSEILALNRGHWEIENRLHHVRDFSYDEDRSRVRNGWLPRNLARLSNAAVAIVRRRGRFPHQPQAHRHYAARQQDALDEVLRKPD